MFREWPYLYDGTLDYEHRYLAGFATAPDAVIVAAYDGEAMVGAATAAPLAGHTAEFIPLFAAAGFDPATVFYCGESVLLPSLSRTWPGPCLLRCARSPGARLHVGIGAVPAHGILRRRARRR